MAISYDLIEKIRQQADIVQVISSYLEVTKKGADYVSLCPFHHDTHPSMSISPSKQIFKCFVCGTSGNVFGFVMQYEHVPFLTAVKKVCQICHIQVPEAANWEAPKKIRENEEEYQALNKLTAFYSYMLQTVQGKPAKEYLEKRGLDDAVIQKFRLGYAPSGQEEAINYLRSKEKIPVEVLDKAGIISASSSLLHDRYKNRVMFPLSDISGSIVGFSGRKFASDDTSDAKYINSPETILFKKSQLLYNYDNAMATVHKDKYLYVLEGFMDVIALYRSGIESCVGLMGTALTKDHIDLFRRLNVEIRLSLDSDDPGQTATEKCLALLEDSGLSVKVVAPLTDGKDPDELLKAEGKQAVITAMNNLESPLIHSLNYHLKMHDLNTYEEKEAFLRSQRRFYFTASVLAKADLAVKLGEELGVAPDAVKALYDSYQAQTIYPQAKLPLQVTELSDENLIGREVNNAITAYIYPRLIEPRLKEIGNSSLVRTETQMMIRIFLLKKVYDIARKENWAFVISTYQDLYMILTDYYMDLRHSVEYLREEDFDTLLGMAETYYGNVSELTSESQNPREKDGAEQSFEMCHKTSIGVLNRLKYCTYPGKSFIEEDISRLLKQHKDQKRKYDLTGETLDKQGNDSLLKRFDINFSKAR